MAGYAFARIRFRGSRVLFIVFLATQMIPKQVTLIPFYLLMAKFGWVDSHLSLIVPAMLVNPFAVFLMRQFVLSLPKELEEAALVDGAGRWRTFWNVTLPLMTPVLFFQLVMGVIGALQIMQEAMLLAETGAGMQRVVEVPRPNYMLMVHIYANSFYHSNMAYGIAMLWMLFVLILILTLLVFRSSRYWVYYEVE
jgi:ABC-type glycerol-3-phosphate transport system permease component